MVLRYFRSFQNKCFQNISSPGFCFKVVNNPFIMFMLYINSENQFLLMNESNSKNDNINKDDNQIHIAK